MLGSIFASAAVRICDSLRTYNLFPNQHDPEEESRLRKVIAAKFPEHLPELDIAVNAGMRRSEQYRHIDWSCVDLARRDLFVPRSKAGKSRHISLNKAAVAGFKALHRRTHGRDPIFQSRIQGEALRGARHWFEDAIREAKIKDHRFHLA